MEFLPIIYKSSDFTIIEKTLISKLRRKFFLFLVSFLKESFSFISSFFQFHFQGFQEIFFTAFLVFSLKFEIMNIIFQDGKIFQLVNDWEKFTLKNDQTSKIQ